MEPGVQVAVAAIVFGTMAAIGVPLARAFARRIEGVRPAAMPMSPDLSDRLERIERAVESVALEVERISEGQRFVTKLMSERTEPGRLPESSVQH
jgi:hypothetical protein